MSDLRLHDLLFLLSCSALALGCPTEDNPGDAGSGEGTTSGGDTSTGGPSTSGASMSAGGTQSSSASTTSDATTTDPGTSTSSPTSDSSDGSSGEPTSSTTAGLGICEEFGMRAEECGVGAAVDLEMYCDFTLNDAMIVGMECYDASLEVFVCALEVDCRTLMGGPAGSCPDEYEAAQTICMGG